MPNYKGHLFGGFAVFLLSLFAMCALTTFPGYTTALEWLFFCCAGALFPDVDTKSKGQKWYFRVLFILLIYAFLNQNMAIVWFILFSFLVPHIVVHRGIFHRMWFVIAIPLGAGILLCTHFPRCRTIIWHDILFFIIGALSHLWLDLGFKRMMRW